jgi:HPt (histidine-containing phosphotransfer) domain-containing protein
MNDHIGKPFDLDELVLALLRHVASADGAEAAAGTPAPRICAAAPTPSGPRPGSPTLPATQLSVLLQQGLDLAGALRRLGGRSEVWLRSAQSLAQELPGIAQQFRQGLVQGQHGEAARLMHTLKGTSGTLGLVALAQHAAALETALRGGPRATPPETSSEAVAEAATLIGRLEQAIESAQALISIAVADLLALQPVPPATALSTRDAAALRQHLRPLIALLQASDMAATDVLATLQAGPGSAWSGELAPLADAMTALDFERAAQLCAQLETALDSSAANPPAVDAPALALEPEDQS